jgi:hypothetical protein
MVALVVAVWRRGGRWERLAAAALFVASAVSPFVQDREHLSGPQLAYVMVDTVLFVAFAAIALRSRLWWATWVAGFQLFGVFIHLAMVADEQVLAFAYYRGIAIYTYLVIAAIMVGALTHKRE